jgi:hypothetical protein
VERLLRGGALVLGAAADSVVVLAWWTIGPEAPAWRTVSGQSDGCRKGALHQRLAELEEQGADAIPELE